MNVVGYVRVSRDEDRESYSSILTQRRIIEEYAAANNWKLHRIYEDDNWSGYTFNRPAFMELLRDLEDNKIDIIIAKDLSRIGRHNAHTLLFIERLKQRNKRLILPGEASGYDTCKDENDMLGIYTWFNEMYVKDISRKIKSSIKAKQREGKMLIKEYFGYKRGGENKHKLVVEPYAAVIVQDIFNKYLEGSGYRKIAEYLNNEHYPTPTQLIQDEKQKKQEAYNAKVSKEWTPAAVQRILKNDVYIGTLRLGKTKKNGIKGRSVSCAEDEQHVFENYHEAIISQEIFYEVQKRISNRKKTAYRGSGAGGNLFSGLLFCKECGSYMVAYSRKNRDKTYICGNYHKNGLKGCKRHGIKEKEILQIITEHRLLVITEKNTSAPALPLELFTEGKNSILKDRLMSELAHAKMNLNNLLMQKITDISKTNEEEYKSTLAESYMILEKQQLERIKYLEMQLSKLSRSTSGIRIEAFTETKPEAEQRAYMTKGVLEDMIERIFVDAYGNLEIYLKKDIDEYALATSCDGSREDVNLVPGP